MKKSKIKLYKPYTPYLFMIPWVIGLLAFTIIPLISSLYFSFTDYGLIGKANWVGTENYRRMFADPRYLTSLSVTLRYVLWGVPLSLVFALLIALLLNRKISGISIYRAIYYIPSLFGGSVAIAILWRRIWGADGLVNMIIAKFGLTGPSWISDPRYALFTLIILRIWQFGSPMVIFLAALKQVPQELYEAAEIDGVGKFNRFIYITLPLISSVVLYNLIMQIISAFQTFTPAYIISKGSGGPVDSTLFYTLYLYVKGFTNFEMGYASAMAWVLVVIISIATGISFLISKRAVYYEN